ncbi:MAG: rhodanese-like domain-containing protein [Candidatus Nanopelagicales bacterium]
MGFFARLFGKGEKVDISAATLKPQGVRLIDVRSRGEFQGGHIAGAKNMDVGGPNFAQGVKRLNAKHTYLVYCQSGARSSRAAGSMRAAGLTVLDGGGMSKMQSNGWKVGP